MTSVRIMNSLKRVSPKIENIVIFVSDALRWDYLPASVAARGVSFKTVAASLLTATSFPSMLTGLSPQAHGVHGFFDRIPQGVSSLLSFPGYHTSLWNENTWLGYDPPESTPLHYLLRQSDRISIKDVPTPFIYVEDEKGGHCPYGWQEGDTDYQEWECNKFLRDSARYGSKKLRTSYQVGIDRSEMEFNKRLQVIKERRLQETTLVIFTADHGELLGEYGGHVGHGGFASPEVVFVPTVFIHPSLPGGVSFENDGVIRHVDLYATVMDILGGRMAQQVDSLGPVSLADVDQLPRIGYNYRQIRWHKNVGGLKLEVIADQESVWDKDGGYVFRSGSLAKQFLPSIAKTIFGNSNTEVYFRAMPMKNPAKRIRDFYTLLKYDLSPHLKYGSPGFSRQDAEKNIHEVETSAKIQRQQQQQKGILNSISQLKSAGKL